MSALHGGRARLAHRHRDDEASEGLSAEERAKLAMDSWEPSLLRRLLTVHNEFAKQINNDPPASPAASKRVLTRR